MLLIIKLKTQKSCPNNLVLKHSPKPITSICAFYLRNPNPSKKRKKSCKSPRK